MFLRFSSILILFIFFLPNDTYKISVIVLNNNCTRRDQLFFFLNKGIEFSVNVTAYKKYNTIHKNKETRNLESEKRINFSYIYRHFLHG